MYGRLLTAILFAVLPLVSVARADSPDYSGNWRIEPSQSRQSEGRVLSLNIDQHSDRITLVRTDLEERDKEVTSRFTCAIGAQECEFDENGHKSKVSLWYNGRVLVILKTDGPKQDPTVEWHLTLGAEGKMLTVTREDVAASGKPEKLVFAKTEAMAAK